MLHVLKINNQFESLVTTCKNMQNFFESLIDHKIMIKYNIHNYI